MFLFMVMSFCRCISILTPFRRHNQRLIFGILAVYLVLTSVMMCYPVFVCNEFSYSNVPMARIGQMEFLSVLDPVDDLGVAHKAYLACAEIVSMIAPVIPITITSCITAYNLLFSPAMKAASNNNASRRDGAITILILTASTLICFFPRLLVTITSITPGEHTLTDLIIDGVGMEASYSIIYLLVTGLSLANSCINPCVFLIRGQNMKLFLRKRFLTRNRTTNRTTMSMAGQNRTMDTVLSNGSTQLQNNSKIYQDTKL